MGSAKEISDSVFETFSTIKENTAEEKDKILRQVKVTLSAHKYFVPRKGIIEEQNVKTGKSIYKICSIMWRNTQRRIFLKK